MKRKKRIRNLGIQNWALSQDCMQAVYHYSSLMLSCIDEAIIKLRIKEPTSFLLREFMHSADIKIKQGMTSENKKVKK